MKKLTQLFFIFSIVTNICLAQSSSTLDSSSGVSKINVLTADSLASGNYKDVFSSFFQLAFNDLSGPQKALAFTSNPYAIMVKANPSLAVDTNYVKYKHLRNLNFNVQVLVDSAYHLTGFSAGIKYALINSRDNTVSKDFITRVIKQTDFDTLTVLVRSVLRHYSRSIDSELVLAINHQFKDDSSTFSSLSSDVRNIIDSIIDANHLTRLKNLIEQNPNVNFRQENNRQYQALVAEWQKKPLWTIAANTTFSPNPSAPTGSNRLSSNNVYLSTEFLWAPFKTRINCEFDVIVSDTISNDVNSTQPNLLRNVASIEPGINFTFKSKNNGKSIFEFKLSGTYYSVTSKQYPSQTSDSSTLNATIRLRIIDDIWAPLTFKMDNNGHVYGSLGVKFNFSTLAGILQRSNN